MPSFFERLHKVNLSGNVYEILRRYFAMNAFDGAITTLGVVMGAFVAQINDPRIVLITAISTSFALFVSGAWSAYITELAERKLSLQKLEKKMLKSLENSRLGRATRTIAIEAALVNGLSSFLMGIIIITPFLFAQFFGLAIEQAFAFSIITALSLLALIGAYLGFTSRQSVFWLGLKMAMAGILAIFFAFFLNAV